MADQGYDPVEQRARFATAFQGTTNLDQRRRFAQDISQAKERESERDQVAFEQLQVRNPEVGRMVTGRMAEERQNRESIVRSNLAQDRFTWDQATKVRMEDLNERKLKLQQRQEDRMISKTEKELKDAERFEFDTDAFERGEEELRSQGFLPGSSEYREGVLNLGARHPYVDPGWRRTVYEGARVEMDADDIQAELADIQAKNPGAAVTLSPEGRPTIRQPAKKPEKETTPNSGRMDTLRTKIAKVFELPEEERDADYLGYLQSQFEAEQAKGAPASAEVKKLDVDVARALLKEVGGDKEKARALARERGYQQ